MLRRLIASHPRALAIAAAALVVALTGVLLSDSALVRASYDRSFAFGTRPTAAADSPVVIVYLDLASYLHEKQDPNAPWSRALHAKLLNRLTQARARAVVFDIIFDEPGKDAAADAEFAAALHANGRVLLGAELDLSSRATPGELGVRNSTPVLPHEPFREAAAGWGVAKLAIDDDFVARRVFPGFLTEKQPSLTWATAQFLNLPVLRHDSEAPSRRWLRYYGPPLTVPHVSYSDALDARAVGDDFFRDKIVLIGARPMAGGFRERKDEFRSPFSSWGGRDVFMPAVEIHATQMLNLLRADWLARFVPEAEAWLLVLTGIGSCVVLFRFRPLAATAVAAGLEVAAHLGVAWAFNSAGLWFPYLIVCAVQIPVALLGSILFHSVEWYRTRRRLEAAKREAEVKIREQAALLDKAQDAILVRDLSGRVLYANPSAERLYGWSTAELQCDGAVEQLFAPAAGKLAEAHTATLKKGEWLGELEQATRAGQKLAVESRWTLIRDEAGQPKSVLLINTDITEKKKLEAQFLRSQRMDTIGSLAGGMAHDLNNALSPILMGIQLIGRKVKDEDTRRMLTVMEANTHRGAEMVRQVLTFSRGREGEHELLQLGPLIREMEGIVRQTLPKSITVATMVPRDLWPVLGNSTQLHQVLLNLCVNARDAMPDGGELTLAADNVELSTKEADEISHARAGHFVMLLVSDTGMGIAPETLAKLFEPFFTTKAPGKGTGLGLATIARIVAGHGGFVSVKSEVGAGTTFEVYLPRAETAVTAAASTQMEALPHGSGELILFIDDERALREMAATSLSEYGYRVETAANGAEALLALERHGRDIRLVVSDLSMPVMDGLTLLGLLRGRRRDLPIVLMSGEVESGKENLPEGVAAVLSKPFRLEQLLSAVGRQLAPR